MGDFENQISDGQSEVPIQAKGYRISYMRNIIKSSFMIKKSKQISFTGCTVAVKLVCHVLGCVHTCNVLQ